MKLLAFTDFHASVVALKSVCEKIRKHKPDLVLCCGDMTVFEQNIGGVMARLGALPVKVLVIHGNHEEDTTVAAHARKYPNVVFMHKRLYQEGDVLFVGYGGHGFVRRDRGFERFVAREKKKLSLAKKIVLMTHQPPYGTKLDILHDAYVGNESFSEWIKKTSALVLAVSGHIHETFGKKDVLGSAVLLNPGPDGMIVTC